MNEIIVALVTGGVPLLALWLDSRGTQEARRGLRICAGVYGAVCVWHAVGIWMMK